MASLRATLLLSADPRLISVKGQVNNTKYNNKSCHKTEPETEEEPVFSFFLLRLAKLVLYYHLQTQLLPALFSQTIGQLHAEDVSPDRTPLLLHLGSISAREALVRSYAALVWIWYSIVVLDVANALLATASVLVGVSGPGDWPPLFGSPLTACGLRSFWSRFWHHLARKPYRNFGQVVAGRVGLLLPGGLRSTVEGVVAAYVVFFVSGVSHAAVSWKFGQADWWYADLRWFMLNCLGCSLETVVISVGRRSALRIGWGRELAAIEKSWLGWLVGYVWTCGFFFWSAPILMFPRMYTQLVG